MERSRTLNQHLAYIWLVASRKRKSIARVVDKIERKYFCTSMPLSGWPKPTEKEKQLLEWARKIAQNLADGGGELWISDDPRHDIDIIS